MKHRSLPFEVVSLAFTFEPRPTASTSGDIPEEYSATELKQLVRKASTRGRCLHLADFYQARRKMWVNLALHELDLLEAADPEASDRKTSDLIQTADHLEDIRAASGSLVPYEYHLRQAAKSAALAMRYYRRADAMPCEC
jgi:hypothetical protein